MAKAGFADEALGLALSWVGSKIVKHPITVAAVVGGLTLQTTVSLLLTGHMSFALLLLGVPVWWLVQFSFRRAWFIRGLRREYAKLSVPFPSLREARRFLRQSRRDCEELRESWIAAMQVHSVKTAIGTNPHLRRLKALPGGMFTATIDVGGKDVVKGGIGKIRGLSAEIAKSCGFAALQVKPVGTSSANLRFYRDDPMKAILPIQSLPASPNDRLCLGVDEFGSAATVPLGVPIATYGQSGKGKSSSMYVMLTDVSQKMRVQSWWVDPKGGQEFGWIDRYHMVGATVGNLSYDGYADDEAAILALIGAYWSAMKERQDQLKTAGIRKWTPALEKDYPLLLIVIDEIVAFKGMLAGAKAPQKLASKQWAEILQQIRAAGGQPLFFSQLAGKEDVGDARDLAPITISFGLRNSTQSRMVFDDDLIREGCAPHTITEPGVAMIADDDGWRKIRVAFVDDDDVEAIRLRGVPDNMGGSQLSAEPWRPHFNYRYLSRKLPGWGRILLYTGETNNPERRHSQHAAEAASGASKKWWWKYYADGGIYICTWAESAAIAKAIETGEIRGYYPVGNIAEQKANPQDGLDLELDNIGTPSNAGLDELLSRDDRRVAASELTLVKGRRARRAARKLSVVPEAEAKEEPSGWLLYNRDEDPGFAEDFPTPTPAELESVS